jgi:hypothetical protein
MEQREDDAVYTAAIDEEWAVKLGAAPECVVIERIDDGVGHGASVRTRFDPPRETEVAQRHRRPDLVLRHCHHDRGAAESEPLPCARPTGADNEVHSLEQRPKGRDTPVDDAAVSPLKNPAHPRKLGNIWHHELESDPSQARLIDDRPG